LSATLTKLLCLAPSKEQGQNLPPSEGMQFFGHIAIDGASQQMTVTLKDVYDRSL
jgi:alkaline phosphatase D